MKRITFLLLLITFSTLTASAQNDLKKTRWTGIANIPSPMEVMFEFRQDSLLMLSNTNDILEVMHFSIKDDLLLITKISGMSPCGEEAASYRFSIKNETLFLVPVTDACNERLSAFTVEGYRRKNS